MEIDCPMHHKPQIVVFGYEGRILENPAVIASKQAAHQFSLRRRELGNSLGTLRHSVLCKLAGKHEPHSRLDLAERKRGLFVTG
eukprot:scaffold63014_cov73-Cyclotella_meneghiniana.AAC.6